MTTQEKNLMMNPEHKPLMDLPPVIQHLMRDNIEHLIVLSSLGQWIPLDKRDKDLWGGCIYRVDVTVPVEPPPVRYRQYPVFCGSADRIYKADLTQPNSDAKRIYHLHTVTGMAEFAGIRYKGSQEWMPSLNLMVHGEPVEVRFRVR